ncbi:unnamed protein product, partial [Ectocarpus sp. 12 AP-2014]
YDCKKKASPEALRVKVDSYVVETRVHFPTDCSLLFDSGRKCLDMIDKAIKKLNHPITGWRNLSCWYRRLRNQERKVSNISSKGGRNREARLEVATRRYLGIARQISDKVAATALELSQYSSVFGILAALDEYRELLDKHIDLVRRRLLEGEVIPHCEKMFSIFEQHTQWINKGKRHKKVELGLNVLIATDQHHFILCHQVMEVHRDVHLAVPIAKKICETYQQEKLASISFDRGFYSLPNRENLEQY